MGRTLSNHSNRQVPGTHTDYKREPAGFHTPCDYMTGRLSPEKNLEGVPAEGVLAWSQESPSDTGSEVGCI